MTNFCNIYIDKRSLGFDVAPIEVTTFIINSILGRDSKGPKTVGEICQDRLQDVSEMPNWNWYYPPSKAYIISNATATTTIIFINLKSIREKIIIILFACSLTAFIVERDWTLFRFTRICSLFKLYPLVVESAIHHLILTFAAFN